MSAFSKATYGLNYSSIFLHLLLLFKILKIKFIIIIKMF